MPGHLLIHLLAGLLALSAGCARPADTREPAAATMSLTMSLIERAEAAEQQRRYDQAHALYEQARRQAPDAPSRATAALAHGRSLIAWGAYEDAAAALAEAVRWQPRDAGAWHDLGMVRHHLGDQRGAERALRRSIRIRPRDPRSRIALAALLWKQQRLAEALDAYRALAALPLPEGVRAKVAWAIDILSRRVDSSSGSSSGSSPGSGPGSGPGQRPAGPPARHP